MTNDESKSEEHGRIERFLSLVERTRRRIAEAVPSGDPVLWREAAEAVSACVGHVAELGGSRAEVARWRSAEMAWRALLALHGGAPTTPAARRDVGVLGEATITVLHELEGRAAMRSRIDSCAFWTVLGIHISQIGDDVRNGTASVARVARRLIGLAADTERMGSELVSAQRLRAGVELALLRATEDPGTDGEVIAWLLEELGDLRREVWRRLHPPRAEDLGGGLDDDIPF